MKVSKGSPERKRELSPKYASYSYLPLSSILLMTVVVGWLAASINLNSVPL